MKLIKLNQSAVSETKEVPGLLNCRIDYEVKTAQGRLDYAGPKFTPELWHQVMSFFRWTHKEMQSESQVRLYVNHRLGRWGGVGLPAGGPHRHDGAGAAGAGDAGAGAGAVRLLAVGAVG